MVRPKKGARDGGGAGHIFAIHRAVFMPLVTSVECVYLLVLLLVKGYTSVTQNNNLGLSEDNLVAFGALDYTKVREDNEYWRILTSWFLHSGVYPILANLAVVLYTGFQLERSWHFFRVLFIYIMSGAIANFTILVFLRGRVSASALYPSVGLLGAALAELLINWAVLRGKLWTTLFLVAQFGLLFFFGFLAFQNNFGTVSALLGGFFAGLFILPYYDIQGSAFWTRLIGLLGLCALLPAQIIVYALDVDVCESCQSWDVKI